jgi:hypothetical protein
VSFSQVETENVIDRCDIDERFNITGEQFYKDYWLPGKPVILRGEAKDWVRVRVAKSGSL